MKTAGQAQGRNSRARGTIPAGRRMRDLVHDGEVNHMAHKEYVTDWGATTTFTLSPYTVQPRNTLLFPRLSAIAARYEKYQFKKLIFRYRTQAVTTDAGSAFMYFDPDCYDTAADSKLVLLNHRNSARNKLYEDFELRIDPKDLGPVRFLRSISASTGDQNLYDAGILRLGAMAGSAKVVGELEVDYEIDLISPNIDPEDIVEAVEDYYNTSAEVASTDDLTNAFDPDGLLDQSSYLVPFPQVTGGGGTSALAVRSAAEFLVDLYLVGTGITTAPTLQTDSAVGEKKTITKQEEVFTTTKLFQQWACYFNNPSNVTSLLTFVGLVATTLTSCIMYIRPLASSSSAPPFSRLSRLASIKGRPVTEAHFPFPSLFPRPVAAVEPATPVAKSREGTCVMLPDLSSPRVSVPTPSPSQRKFVLICKRCRSSQEDCECIDTDLVVRNCCTNNCKADCLAHPD
jgi:hypothetical protein